MINYKPILLLLILATFCNFCFSQAKQTAVIAFYNVENLFDTEDDPTINDEEFLPNGANQWTEERYVQKLKNLSQVIAEIGKADGCPVVLGLCEIENERVMLDLAAEPLLKRYNYGVAHHNSPDWRGVDVAFIYQKERFKLLSLIPYTLKVPENPTFVTRDQLLMIGVIDNTDTLHLIVNHWPSKRGGERRSLPLRVAAAKLTRSIVDSVLQANINAKVIIMGDFNDNPTAKSFQVGLRAKGKIADVTANDIFNPMWRMYRDGIGSYPYQDNWDLIDQILVTHKLLQPNPNSYKFTSAHVFRANFLLTKTGSYQGYPLRTYAGGSYQGGYSDHLPVYILLEK